MEIEYDGRKNAANIAKHGVSFDGVHDLDFALIKIDERFNYGETRYITYGMLNKRLHVLVWTKRNGAIRPISFRKANNRERKQYETR